MQLMAKTLGSEVRSAGHREYGKALVHCVNGSLLFRGVGRDLKVWASHGDRIESATAGFHVDHGLANHGATRHATKPTGDDVGEALPLALTILVRGSVGIVVHDGGGHQ